MRSSRLLKMNKDLILKTLLKYKLKVPAFAGIFYLKKESTNSYLLKTCKSSIPSPTPIYFTGI